MRKFMINYTGTDGVAQQKTVVDKQLCSVVLKFCVYNMGCKIVSIEEMIKG